MLKFHNRAVGQRPNQTISCSPPHCQPPRGGGRRSSALHGHRQRRRGRTSCGKARGATEGGEQAPVCVPVDAALVAADPMNVGF